MTKYERAAQYWSLVALAVRNRQVLTYDIVAQLTGVPRVAVGGFLDPVQAYCLQQHLPPLIILVVGENSGLPGEGFIAAQDIPRAQAEVFAYEWQSVAAPSPEALERAYLALDHR
jgi:putative restriction endonuclease